MQPRSIVKSLPELPWIPWFSSSGFSMRTGRSSRSIKSLSTASVSHSPMLRDNLLDYFLVAGFGGNQHDSERIDRPCGARSCRPLGYTDLRPSRRQGDDHHRRLALVFIVCPRDRGGRCPTFAFSCAGSCVSCPAALRRRPARRASSSPHAAPSKCDRARHPAM